MREELLYKLRDRIIENAEIEIDDAPEITANIHHNDTSIYFYSGSKETVVEMNNDIYPCREYVNVITWLEEHLQRDDVLQELRTRIMYLNENEWEAHGFSGAADYYHYRFG